MNKAISQDTMKKENILSVLQCIQENGPIYRKDVKKITGLSGGSISSIVNRLLNAGLITERPYSVKTKGRNPGKLEMSSCQHGVIGIDINQNGLTCITMTLKGDVIDTLHENIRIPTRTAILQQLYRMLDAIKARAKQNERQLIGIGISMQGSVSGAEGVSRYNAYFNDWENVPLVKLVEDYCGCTAILEHSTECAAITEMKCGVAKGVQNFIFVRISTALGISIIHNGEFIRGYNGNAGEFGHIIMKPDGELCNCGKRGCLETVASSRSIIKHIVAQIDAGAASVLASKVHESGQITMDNVYRAYCSGDPVVRNEIEQFTSYLALGLSTVINLFNPEMLVLGGDMLRYEGMFIEQLRHKVEALSWANSSKTILTSASSSNTAAMGAGLLIIDDVLTHMPFTNIDTKNTV